jgi:hypothetical protein
VFRGGPDGLELSARLLRVRSRPLRLGVRLFQLVSCRGRIGACALDSGLRGIELCAGLFRRLTRPFRFDARLLHLLPCRRRVGPRVLRFSSRSIQLDAILFRLLARPFRVGACLLDFLLRDTPGRINLLLRLRPQLLEAAPQVCNAAFSRAAQFLAVLLCGGADARYLRLGMRTDFGRGSFDSRPNRLLSVQLREADSLL